MPIIEDYEAIARRLRELNPALAGSREEPARSEKWRELAEVTAREYVQSRRRGTLADLILQKQRRRRLSG